MRRKVLAGNWKMNLNYSEAKELLQEIIKNEAEFNKDVETIICPPSIYLAAFSDVLKSHKWLKLGAQNCHYENNGAFTGEISANQLKELGVAYCLVGHSERRNTFNEGYVDLSKKIKALLKEGVAPIFCCGEQYQVRESNVFKEFVMKQIEDSLFGLKPEEISHVIIAYEPIWAIGTGKTASTEEAQEIHQLIRHRLSVQFNEEIAKNMIILYGGSCKPENAKDLFLQNDIDGGLIGGASLKTEDFLALSKSF